MTSTNDGKDVKSNQKSSQKGKTYYIELYKSLESRLSGDSTGEERTRCVGEAWRRVHSLCGHSAPSTHPHLLCWLQRHTARTVLQTEWPKSPDQHTILIDAIDAFLQDCSEAISKRNGESLDWESQLQQWAEGFKKILPNPWGHPVLQALLGGQVPSDEEILEWLKQERGVMLVTRLRQMVASKSCVDLALKLAATLRTRTRPPAPTHADGAPESAEAAQDTTEFAEVLRHEAGFTPDVWNFLMDIEFVLLDKVNNRPSCIELAKQIPFREACPLVERLNSRLESSPQEKKLWKNAKEVAVLIAQVVIARCMLVPVCRGDVLVALKGCFRSAVHMMGEEKLSTCSVGLAALATTARHLHTMAAAAHKQLKRERTPFVCQLYVRAITAGMNELEKLKLATEKEAEARSTEQTLSSWFTHLGSLLSASNRLRCECLLTAFSVHPSPTMYDMVKTAPHLEAIKDMQEPNLETTSEFGSWSTDSRTQTNLVKTSETLNIKHTQKQANVLSTAIFSEGEALGLEPELCNDLAVLLSGPRVKTLTWDMEREVLLENCRTYMERTHGGTKALTTELKYLNLDPSSFQHLPEEDDNEDDVYYGIEKGYEHLLEAQEPSPEYHPQLWQDPFLESPSISSDESLIVVRRRKKKKKRVYIEDPLKLDYETNSNKATERSTSIGESKSNSRDTTPHHSQSSQDADYKDTKPSIEAKESKKLKKEKKQGLKKEKKELKERKKREKSNIRSETQTDNQKVSGGLSRLLGMKVIRKTDEKDMVDMDNALKLQSIKNDEKMAKKTDQNKFMDNKSNRLNNISNESKSSGNSHENSSVVFDGLFSMDDMKFPDTQIILQDKTHNILSFNATNPPPLAPIKPDVKNSTSQNITNNKINEEVKKSVKRLIDFRRQKLQDQQVSDLLQCREEFPSESALLDSVSPKFVQVPDIPTAVISKPNKDFLNVPKPQTSNETNTRHNDKTRENNFIKQKTSKLSEKGVTESASQRAFEEFLKLQSYDAVNLLASPPLPQPVAKVDNVTQKKFEHLLNHNAKNQVSLLKTSKSKPQDLSQKKGPQKTTPKPSCNTDVPINKDVAPNPTQIPNTKSPSTMYDPTQKHFQNFLKELQQSINAGAFAKQNISSEKFTANKIFKQQKIADNAPNTFSRLSYLHKSKQMENKMKTEEEMRAKTDSNHLTTDLDKMLQLQSNGQIVISRVNKNQVKKPIDPMPVRSVKKPKPVSKIAQNHPHLINSLQAKSTIGNCNANQTLHNNLISQYSTKVETASTSTALSEKDQADLLLLLRQKSKLNAGYFAQNKTYFNDEFYSSCPTTNITDSSLKCQPDVQPHNTNLLQQPIHNSIVNVSKLIEASVTNQISGSRHDVTTSIPITNELKTNLTNTNTVIKTVNSVAPRYIQFKVLQKDEQEVYEINNDMNLKESCNFRDSLPKKEINEHASIANHFSHIDDYLSYHNNYHPVQPLSQQNIERNMNEVAPALLQEPQMNMFMTSSTEIKESEKNQLNIMICPSTQEKVEDKIPLPVKQSSVQVKSTDTKKKSVPKVAQTTAKPQQDEPPKSDWESVLDDLLKHKTPSRGPKALDVALKRDSFEKHLPQKQKTESSKKKGRGANYDSIKIDSASKKNTTHSQVFQPFTETLNSTKKPNEASSTQKFVKVENSKEEDPFISGIHNSDYDLLDELMDEDLRQEIDDAYRPVDLYTPKEKETLNTTSTFMTTENFIQKEIPPSSISDLRPNIGTNIQNNVIKCNNPKSVILNIPKKASSNATLDSKPRVISNELIVSNTKIDKNIMKKTKPKQNITQKPAIKIDTTALSTNLKINRKESQGNINVSSPIVNIVKKSVKINCTSNIHKSNSEIPTSSGKTVDTTEVLFAPQLIKSSQNLMGLQSNICNKSFIQSNPQDATVRNNAYNCATATPNVFIDNPPCNSKQVGSPVILNNIAGSTLTKPSINFTPTQQISTLDDGRDMKLQTTVNAANNLYKNNVAAESMANTLPNYKSTKNLTTKSGLTKNVKVNDDAKHYSYRGSYLGKSIIQNNDPIRKQTIDEAILNNERKVLSEVQEKLQHAPSEKCEPKNNLIINKKSLFEKDIIYESIETKNNLVINKKKVIENDVKSHDSKEIEFDQVMNKINAFENNPKLQKSVEDKIILADDSKKALEKSGHTKNIITIQKNLIENPLNSREIIDKERIQNKRRSILNKQTIHNYCREPIPLSYYTLNKITPVNKNHKIEKTNLSPEGVGNIANVSYSDQTSKISQSKTCYSENVKHVESSLEEDCVDQILTGPTNIECNLGGNINSIVNETIGEKSVLMPVKQNNMNICEKTQSSSLKSHKSLFKQYDINSSKRDNQKDLGKVIENLYDKIGKKSTQMTEIKNNTTKISETVKTADITDVENEIKNQNPDKVCKMRDENQIPENGNDVMTTVLHKTNRFECINLDDISSSATKGIESNLNSSESCLNTNLEENTISKNNIDNVNTDPLLEKYRDQIYFEEIPREPKDDPLKRIIRIKLPNGSTFKATISGKLDINVDSIFTDPQMKTILLNNTIKNKKCTLNLRQVTVPDKNNSAEKKFVNEILYPKNVNDDAETINLISDDEDKSNKPTKHVFQTEFGDYCVPSIEKEVLLKHQKRFSQKCLVKIERGDILKKIRAAKACLRLESNTISGFQDLPQNMDEEKLFNEGDDNDNIIEIDDSSNDSVNNIKMIKSPERQSNIRPKLSRDLDVLKNSNIKRFLLPNSFETIVDGEPIILEETEFVKIGEFENILRESINDEKNRWMSSCFVKLIRCDNDISINNDNVDEPDDSTSSLHRSGSFSILNDYFIDDLELGDDIINQTEESSEKICQPSSRCYSEWLFTKASLRKMALDNSQFNNCLQCEKITLDEIQDVSTDYESDLDSYSSLAAEQNKHQCVDQNQLPPSLVSIMTKYFANNPIIDLLKPLAAVNHSVPAINLKRKTVHASADQGITKSKISKTIISMNKPLELHSSNDSCIHNIVNIPEAIDGNLQKEEKLQIDIMIDNEKVEKRVRSDDKVTIENKDEIQIPTTKQHKEYVCANQIPSNLKEDKTKFALTSNDTIFSNDNDCLRMSTSPMDKAREYNNMCTSYFDYTYTVRCVVKEFLKKEKESWDENSLQFNQIKYKGITDIKNSTDDIFDSNSVRRELTESDEHSNKLKDVHTKDNLGGLSIDQIKLDGLTTEKEYVADSILEKKETKETYEKPNENIQKIVDDSKNLTIKMPAIIKENSAVFSVNDDVSDCTIFNEGNQTSTDVNRNSKDLSLYHKTHNNNLEIMLPKSNVSAQKNVTLIYSANSEVILKGSEYKDPKIGTCYLFPLRTYLKKGEENGVLNVLKINTDHSDNGVIEKTIDEDDFHIMIPKLTYSRHRIDTNTSLQYLNSFIKRNLKRKRDSVDTKNNEKRYRKGKNIDYPKFTVAAMEKSAYVKEFNRLIDYWNNVKFSFSRSYHKIENFDVCDLLKSWPIEGTINVSANDCTDENVLFIYDNDEAKFDYDPLHKSFAEELASEYQENEYKSIEINETNFSMGFGEGSDRVIQSYVDRNTLPKISAATLSDVKHAQPSLSFEYCKNLNKTSEDKIEVTQRYISYVRLKDKVRSFFKRTALELHNDWILNNTKECKNCDNIYESSNFPFDVNNLDFFGVPYSESVVQVVQVGQLPVSAAAQNPVTCDPRVTQVTDASPPQCSAENSPRDGSQASMKTEYTELTTADLSIPLVQEYDRHNQTMHMLSQENHKLSFSDENIPIETEVNSIVKIEIAEEVLESEEQNENVENELMNSVTNHDSNRNYSFDTNTVNSMDSQDELSFESLNNCNPYSQHEEQNDSSEKTDQIAHAMNAAGINTNSESLIAEESQTIGNILCDKSSEESRNATQNSHENYSKTTAINALALQQALAQILPPPLNRTNSSENNNQNTNTPSPQVLHIVQGKNSSVNQLTLVDSSQKSVINASNSTPVLHIVQNKGTPNSSASSAQQSNSFNGLSLVDGSNIQQGSNQLLHIVNAGSQKSNSNTGQLLKRVNLLTNLSNVQGNTEQKMVQFVCKSADGKSIQLNAPHQRSMVLRLQPIESTNAQNTNCTKTSDNQNDLNSNQTTNITNSINVNEGVTNQQEIKSRSVYEENYAKFIQNAGKPAVPEKSTSLPKFNQAFGKQVFQDESQKVSDINENHSHISTVNTAAENSDCQSENSMSIEQMGQMSSPPLLLRKSPVQLTSQSQPSQSNLVQQIKQTITPMNLQTMHGGVIYTRQIPVNIGGGQTINLITVPSTELVDDSNQKQHVNQSDMEPSIIKIVPQNQTASNTEVIDENRNHGSNDCNQSSQPQPVLTQMRIKLPMLSKPSQMVSGTRVVRPSFFQIQRNVIGGANQPVYQQLVLTAAPPLGQQTIRLPQTQTNRIIKVPSETNQTSPESQMSSSTLEQLREFDMVLEQVKERSTVQPNQTPTSNTFNKIHTSPTDTPEVTPSSNIGPSESTQQVLYTIGNNASLNVAYVNRKSTVTTSSPSVSTFVRSPDSSNINDSPSSSTQNQLPHSSSSEAQTSEMSSSQNQHKVSKINTKTKSRPKSSSHPSSSVKINTVTPKPSTQKPFEDEQTTQRILYILAEYKEQVENSPDKDKPAPRRRSNPPSNPGSSKRKKSSSGSRRPGTRDISPVHGEDTCRTMGSEDSSCGTSQGDCTESCMDSHSPQDSPRKVVRKLTFEHETPTLPPRPQPQRNVIVADGQTITVARSNTGKPTTAVLMPANYILPVSMVKSGQQIAIVTNRGPKILTVGGGEGGGNAVLLQRLIGPGLKPVLARPGVRHVRLPAAALHNLQAFTLGQAATSQQPDSTAPPVTPNPPELVDTRATASPWAEREAQDPKPDKQPSPEISEPWNLASTTDPHDYSYEEIVRGDNMDRTVLDAIPDRYSPDMEAQRIFDKMFDIDTKKSYVVDSQDDSPRCGYDIDASDCDDKVYHQVVHRKDGTTQRHHRLTHVSAAALRHRYAILEHELRLQKSLSEECEDLGVDSPSASELFPEAELLFSSSPAHEAPHHSHTPQPTLSQSVPQPDMDDQIATDQLIGEQVPDEEDLNMALGLDSIVTVSGDGMQATITLDPQEFARSHPNTTFHKEPTDESELQPFTIANVKGRHMTSTIFHASRAPATVLVTAPQTTVISQATPDGGVQNNLKYPETPTNTQQNLPTVLVKDNGISKFDSILNDRELHLSNTASTIIHSSGNATQVIRRVCYDDDKSDPRLLDANLMDATKLEDRVATLESMADVDDDRSSPERNTEMFWESNSVSERSDGRRPLDFSSDSDKCCKSPFEENNSTDSSGLGAHAMRLDSVIKDGRGLERSGSADGSSADDAPPPLRTYPPKRPPHGAGEAERSTSGKTRAGERSPECGEARRRASNRGVVKRGCHCCNGSPAPPKPKKSRPRKPTADFAAN